MKDAAWDALIAAYPEAKMVMRHDLDALSTVMGINLVLYDQATGLMWARNGNIAGKQMNWDDAMKWVKKLAYGGYSDWRLPTKEELGSFSKQGGDKPSQWFNANGFNSVQSYYYWSGSTSADGTNGAYLVGMGNSFVYYGNKPNDGYVWPVRSGQF